MRHVWTGNDLTVLVYIDDGLGNRVGDPLLEYCYFQTARVEGTLQFERRPETGRVARRIVTEDYQHEITVDCLYFSKIDELSQENIFNREKCLQLDMYLYDPMSANVASHHYLKIAYATFFSITGEENGKVIASAKFAAELFE